MSCCIITATVTQDRERLWSQEQRGDILKDFAQIWLLIELWWTLMNSDDWNPQMMIITLTRAEVISRRVLLWISLMTQIPCRPLSASLVNKLSEREFNWLFKTTCGNLYNLENLGGCNQNYFVTWLLLLFSERKWTYIPDVHYMRWWHYRPMLCVAFTSQTQRLALFLSMLRNMNI